MDEHFSSKSGSGETFDAAAAQQRQAELLGQPGSPERQAQGTQVHLLRVEHNENGGPEAVTELLRDAEVVGFELLGGTREEREADARRASEILASSPDTPDSALQLKKALKNPWLHQVLTPLIGSGIQVEFLDASTDDPEFKAAKETIEESQQVERAFARPLSPSKHYEMLTNYFDHESGSDTERDELVAEQSEAMTERHSGKRLAIVVGRSHTPELESAVAPGSFTETVVANGHDASEMTLDQEATTLRKETPEEPLEPEFVMRAMLERYTLLAYQRTERVHQPSQAQIIEHASRPARAVPAEGLKAAIAAARYRIYGDDDRYQEGLKKAA